MLNPYEEIIKLLKKHAAHFEEIIHEPVHTSEQAAAVRGIDNHAGAKSLLLKACYPFGSIAGVKMIVDPSLRENEIISLNPGVHYKSIKIKWEDYQKVTNPNLADIS